MIKAALQAQERRLHAKTDAPSKIGPATVIAEKTPAATSSGSLQPVGTCTGLPVGWLLPPPPLLPSLDVLQLDGFQMAVSWPVNSRVEVTGQLDTEAGSCVEAVGRANVRLRESGRYSLLLEIGTNAARQTRLVVEATKGDCGRTTSGSCPLSALRLAGLGTMKREGGREGGALERNGEGTHTARSQGRSPPCPRAVDGRWLLLPCEWLAD